MVNLESEYDVARTWDGLSQAEKKSWLASANTDRILQVIDDLASEIVNVHRNYDPVRD